VLVKTAVVTVLLLGNSQTAGQMGMLLEGYYRDRGVKVHREAASGKGVGYFLSATRPIKESKASNEESPIIEKVLMFHRQQTRIKSLLTDGVDYIIFSSLGGNDAWKGCCHGRQRKNMVRRYRKLFEQLCSYGSIVIFNGSPPADLRKWPKFDKRRAELDKIQEEAAVGTCVIRNSVRDLKIPADQDGYHYNDSAKLYVEHLIRLPGMNLPTIESGN
jgi:hypothetical protein